MMTGPDVSFHDLVVDEEHDQCADDGDHETADIEAVHLTHAQQSADPAPHHAPMMPRMQVMMMPPPSLPGMMNLAAMPAMRPKMIQEMMPMRSS